MTTLLVLLAGLALLLATIAIHYETLRGASALLPRLRIAPRAKILAVIAAAFVAHFLEVGLYAASFAVFEHGFGLGGLAGTLEGNAADYLYLSLTSYTTLGVGDVFPVGPLRLLTAIEALNGLMLIAWSASFTYLAMERLWLVPPARTRKR